MAGFNRVQFFFQDGRFGWTEVYMDATAGGPPLQDTFLRAGNLAGLRTDLLAQGPQACVDQWCTVPSLVWVRVSNTATPRQSLFGNGESMAFGAAPAPQMIGKLVNKAVLGDTAPDNPYSALGLILAMVNGGQSKRSLSGVPDALICDQAYNAGAAWIGAFKNFAKELTNGTWGAYSTVIPKPAPAGSQITQVTQDTAGHPVITLQNPLPADCATKLTVFNYVPQRGTPSINGNYRAFPGPLTQGMSAVWTLRKRFYPLVPLCYGNAVPYSATVVAFRTATLTRPTKRSRGRPFALPRGRSIRRA